MSRAKGTFVTLDRWVFELSPTLPGAAGIVLERLSAQSNYRQKSLTVGQLCHLLPFKERAVQNAVAYLAAHGYAEVHEGAYVLRQPSASDALATRTDVRDGQAENAVPAQESLPANPAINGLKKKELKDLEGITDNNRAQNPAAPVAPTRRTRRVKVDATPRDSTPFQEMFSAIALPCYGGDENLTPSAKGRIGVAAKNLLAAGYAPADVPLILAWTHKKESWRTALPTPQLIEERAPAWKQGAKTAAMPKASELDDQDWAAEARRADERNRFLDVQQAGWN